MAGRLTEKGLRIVPVTVTVLLIMAALYSCQNNLLNQVTFVIEAGEGVPPSPAGTVTVVDIGDTSVALSWGAASDNVIDSPRIEYSVRIATGPPGATVSEIESAAALSLDWAANVVDWTVSGLDADTDYYIAVLVRDVAGNSAFYPIVQVKTDPDSHVPVIGNEGDLSFPTIAEESVTVGWTKATDEISPQTELEYQVVYSLSDNINTTADAEKNGTPAPAGWVKDTAQITVTGLVDYTAYYFNVIVRDEQGLEAAYQSGSAETLKIPRIYYTEGNTRNIARVELDGTGGTEVVFSTSPEYPCSIALDRTNDLIYWGTNGGSIYRTGFDGANSTEIVTGEADAIRDIELDIPGNNLYWTSGADVHRSALDGSSKGRIQPIIYGTSTPYDPVTPWGVDLDPADDKVYWTDYQDALAWSETRAANMDGAESWTVTNGLSQESRDVVVDLATDKIYWTDANYGSAGHIYSHLLPGGANPTEIVFSELTLTDPTGIDLDPDNSMLYWTDLGSSQIFRGTVTGENGEVVVSTGISPWDLALDL